MIGNYISHLVLFSYWNKKYIFYLFPEKITQWVQDEQPKYVYVLNDSMAHFILFFTNWFYERERNHKKHFDEPYNRSTQRAIFEIVSHYTAFGLNWILNYFKSDNYLYLLNYFINLPTRNTKITCQQLCANLPAEKNIDIKKCWFCA